MVQTTQITLRDRIQQIEDAISAGRIDEAMADCQQILARYPDALEIQRLLGEVYLAQGRLEEAQQTFDWILVSDPENVIVYCDRALICEHQSDIDTALDCYQQAYELSRGNNQIRQEFNNLSVKAGQQEFMLSRAGLARLYMRGHLLTQAIQEWEAVLAASPDRQDARLGLLETYWREGRYDEVERMAQRVLEEVPQCLKALLLLAHVASAYNMQRARDLVARSMILDPEMMLAQDLFSDLISSQPNDPFLALINAKPVELPGKEANGHGKTIDTINTLHYAAVAVEDGSSEDEHAAENVYHWGDIGNWSELDTRSVPQAEQPAHAQPQAAPPAAGFPASPAAPPASTWTPTPISAEPPAQEQQIDDYETWASQQEIDDDIDPALLEKQPWFQAEQAEASNDSDAQHAPGGTAVPGAKAAAPPDQPGLKSKPPEAEASWGTDPWATFPVKEESSAPPAWLDMLTNFEKRPPAKPVPSQAVPQVAATFDAIQPDEQGLSAFFSSSDEKEEDMGWPEWLKSLGAETLQPEASATGAAAPHPTYSDPWGDIFQAPPVTQLEPEPDLAQFADWADAREAAPQGVPDTDATLSWTAQIEQPAQAAAPGGEEATLTTLEYLEQSLLSQGFVPLQPGSLSAIAQEAAASTPPALPRPAPGVDELLAARDEAGAATAPEAQFAAQGAQPEVLASAPGEAAPAAQATQPEAAQAPVYSLDMLLDSELETTMRRPAVRLQPMQAESTQPERADAPAARRIDYSTRGADSKLTNKERLVKGYQLQLSGAYDDAMQEYRTLIRNAPESLGEVISNLRALLKLAPKYTAGYRVLGDAYMRQGEYLQAMEAYNKALTIAKRAKSQGR
jgi:tetratricopeptide (TPR) repeat protein